MRNKWVDVTKDVIEGQLEVSIENFAPTKLETLMFNEVSAHHGGYFDVCVMCEKYVEEIQPWCFRLCVMSRKAKGREKFVAQEVLEQ